MAQQPNVLLISLDSVTSPAYFETGFPTINHLISQGTSFKTTISSAPLTPVSHSTILTGLQPYNHGVRHLFKERVRPDVISLPMVLKANGYRNGAFVACAGLNRWYGIDRGFDRYYDEIPLLPDGRHPLDVVDVAVRGSAYTRGALVVDQALEWLEQQREHRFCAFVHMFDAHWPYEPPAPFDKEYADHHPYFGEIGYMDSCVRRLFDELDRMGVLENTLVVCFGDHGEDLGEHGGPGTAHPEEAGHGCLLYDTTQKVPLTFRLPGVIPENVLVEEQVRLVDIAPTILDLLGIRQRPKMDGVSLKAALVEGAPPPATVAYSETYFTQEVVLPGEDRRRLKPLKAVRVSGPDSTIKTIWEEGGDAVEVYDLRSDPGETTSLTGRYVNR